MGKGVQGQKDKEPSTGMKKKGEAKPRWGPPSCAPHPKDEGGGNQGGNAAKRWGPRRHNPKSSGSKHHPSSPSLMGPTEGDTGTAHRETRHLWGDARTKHGAHVPQKSHHSPEQGLGYLLPQDPQIHPPPLKETSWALHKAKLAPANQPAQGATGHPMVARGRMESTHR